MHTNAGRKWPSFHPLRLIRSEMRGSIANDNVPVLYQLIARGGSDEAGEGSDGVCNRGLGVSRGMDMASPVSYGA